MTEDDLRLAEALADAAGAAIRPWFRAGFTIDDKSDASPVTQADRAAEAAMRALLNRARPDDGIVGEEYGVERGDAARIWVLDPIDGTRSFIAGRAIFGTLIALIEDERPVLGVIDQPIAGERWIGAAARPTMLNGQMVRSRACADLSRALFATTDPWLMDLTVFERLRGGCRSTLLGGDCHNYGLLAAGQLDLVVEEGLKLYDFAALVPVVEGAGGRMTDWQGRPLSRDSMGQVVAVGDVRLLDQVLSRLG